MSYKVEETIISGLSRWQLLNKFAVAISTQNHGTGCKEAYTEELVKDTHYYGN